MHFCVIVAVSDVVHRSYTERALSQRDRARPDIDEDFEEDFYDATIPSSRANESEVCPRKVDSFNN